MALTKQPASDRENAERFSRLYNQSQRDLRESLAVRQVILSVWCIQTAATLIGAYLMWGRG